MKGVIAPRNFVDERMPSRYMAQATTTVPVACCPATAAKRTTPWSLCLPVLVVFMAGSPSSHLQAIATVVPLPVATDRPQLQLNHGERWQADIALREGMRRIRAVALWMQNAEINGPLSARQSRSATAAVEASVAAIVERSPRSASIDANLHILLSRVLAADGLPQLLDVLELYPRYFNDPGWQPLGHNASPDH